MTWLNKTENALETWLIPDTANSGHPSDEERFYDFISYVWIDIQGVWDVSLARDKIKRKIKQLHPDWHSDTIEEFNDYLSKGTLILDFLSNTKKKGLLTRFI